MYEPHKVAYRHPKYKTQYRVKNWPEYDKSLSDRGDIAIWFSQDAIDAWTPQKNGKRGGQSVYSNIAIETSLSLRLVFQLPLRQTEGFLGSIFRLMSLDLPCPDHTTLSRRNQTVEVQRNIDKLPEGSAPTHGFSVRCSKFTTAGGTRTYRCYARHWGAVWGA